MANAGRNLTGIVLGITLGLASGCRPGGATAERGPTGGRSASSAPSSLDAGESRAEPQEPTLLAGCTAVHAGGACVAATAQRLTLWIPGSEAAGLRVEGGRILGDPRGVAGGHHVLVELTGSPGRLVVARGATSLLVRDIVAPVVRPPALVAAITKAGAGNLDGAAAELTGALAGFEGAAAPSPERAALESALARVESARGHAAASAELFRRSIDDHAALGELSAAADDAFARSFAALSAHEFPEASTLLTRAAPWASAYPEGAARRHYYEGLLSSELGRVAHALPAFAEAERLASRAAANALARMAKAARALELVAVGRRTEGRALLSVIANDVEVDAPCERGDALVNLAWTTLLAREAGEASLEEASAMSPKLEEAVASFAGPCKDVWKEANARLTLARLRLDEGRIAEARRSIDRVASAARRGPLADEASELRARLSLVEGRVQAAVAAYRRLAREAAPGEPQWRAQRGLAEALARAGYPEEAILASRKAIDVLLDRSAWVPLGEGRGTYLAAVALDAVRIVDVLVRLDRAEEALHVLRRTRLRVLETLASGRGRAGHERACADALAAFRASRDGIEDAARKDWARSREQAAAAEAARRATEVERFRVVEDACGLGGEGLGPSPVPAGVALVALVRFSGEMLGLVSREGVVTARRWPASAPGAPVSLEPLAAELAGARRIALLVASPVDALDVALPRTAAGAVREHVLDFGREGNDGRAAAGAGLVVADPTQTLPHARAEGLSVAAALRRDAARGPLTLLVGAEARRGAVLAGLERAPWFHFAGHAVFAGEDGWGSALLLAAGERLRLGDVLALPHAPPAVVLAGCETARTSEGSALPLGLAQAFLLAGADAVVAAARPLDDASSARLVEELYAMRPESAADLADALARAEVTLGAPAAGALVVLRRWPLAR